MKFSAALIIGASLLAVSPAAAQNAPGRTAMAAQVTKQVAGATIFDPPGAAIGTLDTVTAHAAAVNTGSNKVALPPPAHGSTEKELVAPQAKDSKQPAEPGG